MFVNASNKSAAGNEAESQHKRESEEDQVKIYLVIQDMKMTIKEGNQHLRGIDI